MPLPLPPQIGPPIPGSQGGMGDRTAYVPGLQGYRPNPVSSITQGVGAFLQAYTGQRKAEEDRELNRGLKMIELMGMGIPVDPAEIAKAFQKAGMKLQTEAPPPPAAPPQPPMQPPPQGMMGPGPGMPGMGGVPPPSMPQTAPAPAPPSPPQPQQGALSKFFLGNQVGPPPQPGSPFMESMGAIQKAGFQQNLNNAEALQHKATILSLTKAAMEGDKKAEDAIRTLGIIPQLNQWGMFEKVGKLAGLTPDKAAQRFIDIESAPLIGVMGQMTASAARLDFEQRAKLQEEVFKWAEAYPAANPLNIQAFVIAKASGDAQLAQKILQSLGPSKYSDEQGYKKFEQGVKVEELKLKKEEGARGWETVRQQAMGQASEDFWKRKNYELSQITQLHNLAKDKFDAFFKVATSKEVTDDTKINAAKGLVEAANAMIGREAYSVEEVSKWFGDDTFNMLWNPSKDVRILEETKPLPESEVGKEGAKTAAPVVPMSEAGNLAALLPLLLMGAGSRPDTGSKSAKQGYITTLPPSPPSFLGTPSKVPPVKLPPSPGYQMSPEMLEMMQRLYPWMFGKPTI